MYQIYRALFHNYKCSPKNLFFDFLCNIHTPRVKKWYYYARHIQAYPWPEGKSIVERPENAFEGTPLRFIIQPGSPFRWTTTATERKNLGNRRTRFLQLALTSWFYSFHELALHNPFASGSFFARNLRCADRFRVYVNLLEITSSKRRRTVIPLPREESATALKRAAFMRDFPSRSWRFFSDFSSHIELRRGKSGSGFVHRRTVIYLQFAVLPSAG